MGAQPGDQPQPFCAQHLPRAAEDDAGSFPGTVSVGHRGLSLLYPALLEATPRDIPPIWFLITRKHASFLFVIMHPNTH